MYEIIMQSFLCCFDFLIVLMLFHHFLLDRWEKSILGIIIKAISVLVCGVSLACINFFGVFWLNVIVAVILNLSMALSFYKGQSLNKIFGGNENENHKQNYKQSYESSNRRSSKGSGI